MQQEAVEDASIGQDNGYPVTDRDMEMMRSNDMPALRAPVDKRTGGMYEDEGHLLGAGQYSSHMHFMPPGYHGGAASAAYRCHMAADRDYSGQMDEVTPLIHPHIQHLDPSLFI